MFVFCLLSCIAMLIGILVIYFTAQRNPSMSFLLYIFFVFNMIKIRNKTGVFTGIVTLDVSILRTGHKSRTEP